jgi:hypothetical protein
MHAAAALVQIVALYQAIEEGNRLQRFQFIGVWGAMKLLMRW